MKTLKYESMNTDTPRTDSEVENSAFQDKNHPHTDWVPAYFARTLERQLTITPQRLADVLMEVGLVHSGAIEDKEGYDDYRTWDRISKAAKILSNNQNP